jgi:hypothetical protein
MSENHEYVTHSGNTIIPSSNWLLYLNVLVSISKVLLEEDPRFREGTYLSVSIGIIGWMTVELGVVVLSGILAAKSLCPTAYLSARRILLALHCFKVLIFSLG